jgi:beta-N-acetylhexosaminidase
VQIHVLDREAFQPVRSGMHLLAGCIALAPEKFAFLEHSWEGRPCHMDLLAGSACIREHLSANKPVEDLLATWKPAEEQFAALRTPYLLYE